MSDQAPKPEYRPFSGDAEFQLAVDQFLDLPGRELRIFEPDGSALRLNSAARIALLEGFLRASRTRRIMMVVHDTDYLARGCPRMMDFIKRFNHSIQINRTHEEIRSLQDAFMVLDAAHYVRRPMATFLRGAIGINDDTEALAMRSRFLEIWSASFPAVAPTTVGL
ncbi:MAG TPA: hypothetical protein VFO02_08110 [Burkholderiales bacterium]|nr:hypothetical protein [Burkholderiales bacterium]